MKIALTHASNLLAEVLLQALFESGLAPDSVVLLDDSEHLGERHAYGKTHLIVGDQDDYDYQDLSAVFMLGPDSGLESLLQHADCPVISHAFSAEASARFIDTTHIEDLVPGLNRISGAEVATLTHVLRPLIETTPAISINVVNVLSAALFGQSAVETLASQTVSLLNSRGADPGMFDLQLAFNMIPQPADAVAEAQLAELFPSNIRVGMHSILVGALHGMAQSVDIEFTGPVDNASIERMLEKQGKCRIEHGPVSPLTHCKHGANPVLYDLGQPQKDAKRVHFWIIADSIRNGLVQNYLQVKGALPNSLL